MPTKSVMTCLGAAILFFALPARSQESMQGRAAITLPDGEGKEIVQTARRACHSLGNITNSGHSLEEWKTTVAMMLNVGANVPKDKVDTVTDYLVKNFPEKPAPPAVAIAGNVEVSFKEWKVPTPGSRPHDPLAAPDGTIWYTGHMGNLLGHIDPKTGDIKEYHQTTPASVPQRWVWIKQ